MKNKIFKAIDDNRQSIIDCGEYILNNFQDKDMSVTTVAEKANITRGHLYKIFKEKLNLSPAQFITKCRIEESILLLYLLRSAIATAFLAPSCPIIYLSNSTTICLGVKFIISPYKTSKVMWSLVNTQISLAIKSAFLAISSAE